jgi:amino acid adenylation domain-containing protein
MSDIAVRLRRLPPTSRRALIAKLSESRNAVERVAPLSYAQQRLWFLEQFAAGNPYYNETSAYRFLFRVDVTALRRSLNKVVQRHEALRTVFVQTEGEPEQHVLPQLDLEIPVVDLSALRVDEREQAVMRIAERQGRQPFDLARGPLLRAALVRLAELDSVFVLTMHHIVCDGWSMRLFFEELQVFFEAEVAGRQAELPPLPLQYADFAEWQRGWLTGPVLDGQLEYWREQLADAPALELPVDFRRPATPTFGGAREAVRISAETYAAIKQVCDEERATPFMALLAAYQVFLHRYSGQDDIAVGSPVANRGRPEDERLIGFFVNTVVMRSDLSGEPSFRQLLRRVRDVALSAYEHQDLPFERIVEDLRPERDSAQNPIFQVTFQMLRSPARAPQSTELIQGIDVNLHTSKFDLRCDVWEEPTGGVDGYLEFSTDLFRPERVHAMARHFETLVSSAAAVPEARIGELQLLTAADEKRLVVDWNDTATGPPPLGCVQQAFELCAARDASALAVIDSRSSISYGELNERSNRLARYLGSRGVIPGSLVAVLLDRSVEYVVAIVAIVKAGAAYIPLDPAYPDERLALIMRDGVPLVLTTERYAGKLPPRVDCVRLDTDRQRWADLEPSNLPLQVDTHSLAYVVFTSGSTGRPKGVEVLHRGLANLVCWHNAEYQVTAQDRATLYANPAFDASVWEMWPYLSAGASLWIPDGSVHASPGELIKWMAESEVTISFLPTPVAEEIVGRELPAHLRLRALLTGGDRLRTYPERKLPFRFVNHYGPTEATVVATFADVSSGHADESPPIGRPIANMQAFVLDRYLQPVPPGVKGELYLAGRGLARGYLNDSSSTRDRFVPNPFDRRSGSRMYRTGDLVRRRLNGDLEFQGRVDRQLKIRGFRIEPEDIEAVLDEHPSVRKSLVMASNSPQGDPSIDAYIVPEANGSPTPVVDAEADRTLEWQRIYDSIYAGDNGGVDRSFDLVGWNSSYTGQPLSDDEMREQVEATVQRIRDLDGDRILEIGCGTGLLLFRLAATCDRYVATDFSGVVVESVRSECERRGLRHVELVQCPADDFSAVAEGDFDVVVLNSVAQYFPGIEYLVRVLTGAARAVRPGGSIFVGDVRNLRLLPWLHAGLEVDVAEDETSRVELRERIARRADHEQELVIDPRFFSAWAAAEGIDDVQFEVRRGRHHNEITKFRYDVVLGVGRHREPLGAPEERRWEELDGVGAWCTFIREHRWPVLVLRDVPSARLAEERRLAELLEGDAELTAAALRREMASVSPGVEPEDLWDLERDGVYTVRIDWSASDADGLLDVWFIAKRSDEERRWELPVPAAAPADARPWQSYANDVLSGSIQDGKTRALRDYLRRRVPEYMVPSHLVWTDRLPVTPNGKFDRRLLPPVRRFRDPATLYASPRGEVEEHIASAWRDVLGLDQVGAETNFFDLGGHSLLLVKVHSRLNAHLSTDLSIIDLFNYPTVRSLAQAMTTDRS